MACSSGFKNQDGNAAQLLREIQQQIETSSVNVSYKPSQASLRVLMVNFGSFHKNLMKFGSNIINSWWISILKRNLECLKYF